MVANDAAEGLNGSCAGTDNFQESVGQKFLEKLDRHFQESPRLIMRGICRGEVLELRAKRRTEGTLVEWKMINTREKTTVLNVRARMTYKYSLGLCRQQYGRAVRGGWALDRFTKRLLWNINGSQVVLMEEYHDKPCRIFFLLKCRSFP